MVLPRQPISVSIQEKKQVLLGLHKTKQSLLRTKKTQQKSIPRTPQKQTLQTQVDTIPSVDQKTKAWRNFLQQKIQERQREILQTQFLLEVDEWPTDEELDSSASDEISDEDSTELEDSMGDSGSEEE